jgi:hypothetical protein
MRVNESDKLAEPDGTIRLATPDLLFPDIPDTGWIVYLLDTYAKNEKAAIPVQRVST